MINTDDTNAALIFSIFKRKLLFNIMFGYYFINLLSFDIIN